MGRRKRGRDQNETPHLTDDMTCHSTKDSISKENLTRTLLLKHPRRYGLYYSRRKLTNKRSIPTCQGTNKHDQELPNLKFDNQSNSHAEPHTEKARKAICGPERTRTALIPTKPVYSDPAKRICGLCEKQLKRKPIVLENSVALDDLSVVAVLVCGHVYHADCLETRTRIEDQSDPLCPLCV